MAGWYWWGKLKERCNLSLRIPQNISMSRASTANRTLLSDFHYKVQNLLTKLDLKDKPARIWYCDETGLSYVINSSKTVCQVGRKYVYKQISVQMGVTTTLLFCICACLE